MPLTLDTSTAGVAARAVKASSRVASPSAVSKPAPPKALPSGHVLVQKMKKGVAFKCKVGRTEEVFIKSATPTEAFSLTKCAIASFSDDESAVPIDIKIERAK